MKLFVASLSTLLAVVAAASAASVGGIAYYGAPGLLRYAPYAVYGSHSSSLVTPVQQQYHAQDELGQYSFGYSDPLSAKQEVRSLDGVTRGSYSYRDAENKLQTVDYVADAGGFRVAATNLPKPVPVQEFRQESTPAPVADTADVAAARAAHLAAHQAARMRLEQPESGATSVDLDADRTVELPRPVQDTDEVAAAKAAHLKQVEHEKQRNEILAAAPAPAPAPSPSPAPAVVYRTPLAVAYRSAVPVAPGVYGYNYNYPLNTRFLANYVY